MQKRTMSKSLYAALFGAALMTASHAVQADVCVDSKARAALEMRVLQSELMVAALTCGQRPSYNAFVATFNPYLKDQGGNLRTFFDEAYGENGTFRLNRLVTRLANEASSLTLNQPTSQFCAQAKTRFEAVLAAPPRQLAHMARANASAGMHGYKSCVEVAESNADQPAQN